MGAQPLFKNYPNTVRNKPPFPAVCCMSVNEAVVHGIPNERPRAIDEFLAVMDDERNYPVLFHCRAGLHRTGCLAAVYRMEYQGWSRDAAWRELRAHGFGEWVSTAANDYIRQYVLTYRPGLRRPPRRRTRGNTPR